jgi:hypothetical protein
MRHATGRCVWQDLDRQHCPRQVRTSRVVSNPCMHIPPSPASSRQIWRLTWNHSVTDGFVRPPPVALVQDGIDGAIGLRRGPPAVRRAVPVEVLRHAGVRRARDRPIRGLQGEARVESTPRRVPEDGRRMGKGKCGGRCHPGLFRQSGASGDCCLALAMEASLQAESLLSETRREWR